jgi:dTDP-4-dehydrorhamnose reductase
MTDARTTVLVLGGTGMLGHTLFERLSDRDDLDVHATVRDVTALVERILPERHGSIHSGVDVSRMDTLEQVIAEVRPAVVINAIGIVRQVPAAADAVASMEINARLPHLLAGICAGTGARLVHIGTDCVFSGSRGAYTELDPPDPTDLYGRSKLLGEPAAGALTLRTSVIGHELRSHHGLLEWFLAQTGAATGYRRAIFSGLTTVELARVVADVVLPYSDLAGVYHLSSAPISKLELLKLVARRYDKQIEIVPADTPVIDRSLDSSRFRDATGYRPPTWPELIDAMFEDATTRYPSRVMAPTAR